MDIDPKRPRINCFRLCFEQLSAARFWSGECTVYWADLVSVSCDFNENSDDAAKLFFRFLSLTVSGLEQKNIDPITGYTKALLPFFSLVFYLRFLRFCSSWELPILIRPLLKLLLLWPEPILIDWLPDWWWMDGWMCRKEKLLMLPAVVSTGLFVSNVSGLLVLLSARGVFFFTWTR